MPANRSDAVSIPRIRRTGSLPTQNSRSRNGGGGCERISFGNLSVGDGATAQFYITATGTGGLAELALTDLANVVTCDFATNSLRCEVSKMALRSALRPDPA